MSTSIQRFLGHRCLESTLVYARAHDQTVADDYFRAMGSVEIRLNLLGEEKEQKQPLPAGERSELLVLASELTQPELSSERRVEIAVWMCQLLGGVKASLPNENGRIGRDHPPPSSVSVG
jgi:hypothetical protein